MLWSTRDVETFLEEGEGVERVFPVRYEKRSLPYGLLFSGCILVLTENRVVSLAYGRLTSRPAKVNWSHLRKDCRAVWEDGRLKVVFPGILDEEGPIYVVSASHTLDAQRFAEALEDEG